ncbi:hypothetical protein [Micromonospora sp. CPCC 205556]|uniref:hypothetical protein n=1 Tax=Micromonospora sp. CPCC 205556 TaxID=3122398 RepID=UPI002FF0E432
MHELETEAEAKLAMAAASHREEAIKLPVTEWLFDPADAQRDEVGLRSLLGAVGALEGDPRFGRRTDGPEAPHHADSGTPPLQQPRHL